MSNEHLINTSGGRGALLIKMEFNLPRTRLAPLVIAGGPKACRATLFSVTPSISSQLHWRQRFVIGSQQVRLLLPAQAFALCGAVHKHILPQTHTFTQESCEVFFCFLGSKLDCSASSAQAEVRQPFSGGLSGGTGHTAQCGIVMNAPSSQKLLSQTVSVKSEQANAAKLSLNKRERASSKHIYKNSLTYRDFQKTNSDEEIFWSEIDRCNSSGI